MPQWDHNGRRIRNTHELYSYTVYRDVNGPGYETRAANPKVEYDDAETAIPKINCVSCGGDGRIWEKFWSMGGLHSRDVIYPNCCGRGYK